MANEKQIVDVSAAKAFIDANWPNDPLLKRIAFNLLDKLPRVEQGWIPVTERLPDTSGYYLTRCHHYSNGDWSEVAPFDAEKSYFVDLGRRYYPFVTHWMPLPEPPKED